MIFRLVKENNLKYREVAELLDISEKTVENQMAIALKKLAASIRFRMV
jgi:RNA polymerase sigma-70 factor (ECF subfamily)